MGGRRYLRGDWDHGFVWYCNRSATLAGESVRFHHDLRGKKSPARSYLSRR